MRTKRRWLRWLAAMALAGAAQWAHAVPTVPLAVDTTNPQYFYYDGQTIALVGATAEFLCHVAQPNQDPFYCTYGTYPGYIQNLLVDNHLNKLQLWIGLNHSPGKALSGTGNPYDQEQPFRFLSGKWNLDQYAERPTPTAPKEFFERLDDVVAYAEARNVIVEVVFFDPWSGDWNLGPWKSTQNHNTIGFSQRKFFASFDNGSGDLAGGANQVARVEQVEMMKKVVERLNRFKNVYWQIANEPEINSANGVTGAQSLTWHRSMIQQLYCHEDTLPGGHHLIGVNFHTQAALAGVTNAFTPCASTRVPKIDIVNGHYVELADSSRYAAIRMIRNFHLGGQGSLNRIFGFNEGRWSASVANGGITAEAARAEAWEFMLNEGGVYDRYDIEKNSARSINARKYLGYLADFLKTFDLRFMTRANTSPPPWASGVPAYPSDPLGSNCRTSPCAFSAAMHWTRNQYALYIHHSKVQDTSADPEAPNFRAYTPVIDTTPPLYKQNLQLSLGNQALTFIAEWINPATGARIGSPVTINWVPGTGTFPLSSPEYSFDIALRIKRQP